LFLGESKNWIRVNWLAGNVSPLVSQSIVKWPITTFSCE